MRIFDKTMALYRVAHDGVSTGRAVGMGRTPKRWSHKLIFELVASMEGKLLAVYVGHSLSMHRKPVGSVIHVFATEFEGSTDAFSVIKFTDDAAISQLQRGQLGAVSIEADLVLECTPDGFVVDGVEQVTAVAVADENQHTPGFKRAGLVSMPPETPHE
jgi:hypothetical protein